MAYTPRELSGSLFKNDKKNADAQPDYQGDCLIEGKTYRMAAWIKRSEGKPSFMSFKFTPKDAA